MKNTPIIGLIDYGMGNLMSIQNALDFLQFPSRITRDKDELKHFSAFILPGVGAFGEAMRNLNSLEILLSLDKEVGKKGKPLLGICLGMQLLANDSDEMGFHKGLGWIDGHVRKIKTKLRLPHVGWNEIKVIRKKPLFERLPDTCSFYFDHSYQFLASNSSIVSSVSVYGTEIISSVQSGNLFGVQFHPEKSQRNGLKMLRGFTNYIKESV